MTNYIRFFCLGKEIRNQCTFSSAMAVVLDEKSTLNAKSD